MVGHEKPFPNEQMSDPGFEEMITSLCTRPGMWVIPSSFATVCAYIDGFNAARGGGPLLGFQEWLVLRFNEGNNLHWIGLIGLLIPDEGSGAEPRHDERIRALGDLIGEYLRYRNENGITKVFYDYGEWLLRRQWYNGPLRRKSEA